MALPTDAQMNDPVFRAALIRAIRRADQVQKPQSSFLSYVREASVHNPFAISPIRMPSCFEGER